MLVSHGAEHSGQLALNESTCRRAVNNIYMDNITRYPNIHLDSQILVATSTKLKTESVTLLIHYISSCDKHRLLYNYSILNFRPSLTSITSLILQTKCFRYQPHFLDRDPVSRPFLQNYKKYPCLLHQPHFAAKPKTMLKTK